MTPNATPERSNPNPFFILLILSIVLNFVFPIMVIVQAPYTYPGIILIGFGIVMNVWADYLLHKRKTTVLPFGSPSSLIVSGPFRISRNPIYLGMVAVLLGIAILFGTLVTFLFPIVFLAIIETMFIPVEERNIGDIFGDEYVEYKHKVRRWI